MILSQNLFLEGITTIRCQLVKNIFWDYCTLILVLTFPMMFTQCASENTERREWGINIYKNTGFINGSY